MDLSQSLESLYLTNKDKAFEYIYSQHYNHLCNIAYKFVGDHSSSEDIVQEVLLSLYKSDFEVDANQSVLAYLKRSVSNRSLNFLKAKHNHFLNDEYLVENHDSAPSPIQELEGKEMAEKIEIALSMLPAGCRSVFLLSRLDQLTNKEIAEQLQISIKTVENQMTSALKKLRQFIFEKNSFAIGVFVLCIVSLLLTL